MNRLEKPCGFTLPAAGSTDVGGMVVVDQRGSAVDVLPPPLHTPLQGCWAQGWNALFTQGRSALWVFSNSFLARGLSALGLYHAAWVFATLLPQWISEFQGRLIKPQMQLVWLASGGRMEAELVPLIGEVLRPAF